MTAPIIPIVSVFPPPPPPLAPIKFPVTWLVANASAPIQYRAIIDVAKLSEKVPTAFHFLPYTFKPAIELAIRQSQFGVWNDSMLSFSAKSEGLDGVGTIHAVRRLLEYGWDKDSPPVYQARRILFRLLAEDDDPALLFEFAPAVGPKAKPMEEEMRVAHRQLLREAAGAVLAQAGFEADPRLRGAARRTLERMMDFLKSPVGAKPWIRIGNQQVLSPDAFPPSIYALSMFAYMPLFRSEHYEGMELLYRWLSRPLPRQEQMKLIGKKIVPVPLAVMGDRLPHRNAVEDDVPAAIAWLEMVARLGFLRRNENWTKMYERFVDDCGRDGVWHPHKGLALPKSSNAWAWSAYPLEPVAGGDERYADITFRIGLIARLSGRPVELV